MFCEKCGTRLDDGAGFCGNCGSPVVTAPQNHTPPAAPDTQAVAPPVPAAPAPAPEADYAPHFDTEQKPPKKKMSKKKKRTILIAVVAAVLAVAIFLIVAFATGLFRSAADRNKDLIVSDIRKVLSSAGDVLQSDSGQDGGTYTLTVEPGAAMNLISSFSGIDLSWLKNAQVEIATDLSDDAYSAVARVVVNGKEITAVKAMIDAGSGRLMLGIDGLSDSFGMLDFSTLGGMNDTAAVNPSGAVSSGVDSEKIIDMTEKYVEIILDAIDDVEESRTTLTANGVQQSCTAFTYTVTMDTVIEIADKLIDAITSDGDFKDILRDSYASSGLDSMMSFDEFYAQWKQSLTAVKSNLSMAKMYMKGDTKLATIVDYVADGEIIGFSFNIDSKNFLPLDADVFFGVANDGGSFGVELTVNGNTYLSGGGTSSGSTVTGELQILSDEKTMAKIKLTDFDYEARSGVVEISLARDTWYMMTGDSDLSAQLALVALKLQLNSGDAAFDIVVGGNSVLKMNLIQGEKKSVAIDRGAPTKSMSSWVRSLDLSQLKRNLRDAGVPANIREEIAAFFERALAGLASLEY